MKKWLLITLGILLLASTSFYFAKKNEKTADSSIEKIIEEKDYANVLDNPNEFIGYKVEGEGLVEESIYEEGIGVFTTVILNTHDYSDLVLLYEEEENRVLESRTSVFFSGKVAGLYKEKDVFKRAVNLPKVNIDSIEIENQSNLDQKDLFEVAINKEKQKEKIAIELEKVAIYKSATRIYLSIRNHSQNDAYLNEASIQLLADGIEIPTKYEMLDKKLRLERYLNPGEETYGALSFKKVLISTEKLQLKISFSSEEKKEPIDFYFKVNL
ncbi:MAG: hypothetical protein KBT36_04695 [Kurthia sp.]|nr:hypothetical protein [Candidatus Kurthia equi]